MDSIIYNTDRIDVYTCEKVMTSRMLCSQYLFTLKPKTRIISQNSRADDFCTEFSEGTAEEIVNWLYSYDNRIYVIENGSDLWAIVPTFFYCTSLVLALKFNIDSNVALSLIERPEYSHIFKLSDNIKIKKANKSLRVEEHAAVFNELCQNLGRCFLTPQYSYILDTPRVISQDIIDRCRALSALTGCPVSIDDFDPDSNFDIDIFMLMAFLFSMFLLARAEAPDRSARVCFESMGQSLGISVQINVPEERCLDVLGVWDNISSEKLMPFGFMSKNGVLKIEIQPYRRELSYLGIKQPPPEFSF